MINLILVLLFQIQLPQLTDPTPMPTITPAVSEATGTPQGIETDIEQAEERIDDLESRVTTTEDQLYIDGRPLVPEQDTSMWAYIKWGTSSANRSLFGSFSDMMLRLGILILLVMTSLLIWIWVTFIMVILKLVLFVVRYFIPGLG